MSKQSDVRVATTEASPAYGSAKLYLAPEQCGCGGKWQFTGGGCMGWSGEVKFTTWKCECGADKTKKTGKLNQPPFKFVIEDQ
jgi:hypothetical protein